MVWKDLILLKEQYSILRARIVLRATSTPSTPSQATLRSFVLPIWLIVSIVAGGVTIVGIVIILTWYYCRKSTAANLAQNQQFKQSISIPELSPYEKKRCLDVADFYKFSRRSTNA